MSEAIKSFLVELGFSGDAAGAKRVVDLAQKTEDAITQATAEGGDKRVDTERQASRERIGIVASLGKIFVAQEQDRAERTAKIRKDEAAKDEKLQAERERKQKEYQDRALKEMQTRATKATAFVLKFDLYLKAFKALKDNTLGIIDAADKAARSMERLNYAAQRAGTAPGKLTAYE